MKTKLDFSFNVIDFDLAENGDCTGMVTDSGFTLQYQDKDGNVIPLNKEAIEKFFTT